jgi:hypothetical protein
MLEKLKSFLGDDRSFYGLLVIIVGAGSFLLGRLSTPSAQTISQERVRITQQEIEFVQENNDLSLGNADILSVVASRSGTRYHLPDCPGASQIKESNRVVFESPELARAAGYTPASNCPGLK